MEIETIMGCGEFQKEVLRLNINLQIVVLQSQTIQRKLDTRWHR